MSFELVAKSILKKTAPPSQPRILIHPADLMGCGHYRLLQPAEALFKSKEFLPVASMRYANEKEFFSMSPSHVITQRQWTPEQLRFLKNYRAYSGTTKLVCDIDDLAWLASGKDRAKISNATVRIFKEILSLMDRVVCSTPFLQQALQIHAQVKAHVLPNMIPGSVYSRPGERTSERLRVAWAGGGFHQEDIAILKKIVLGTVDLVDWIFVGDAPKDIAPLCLKVFRDWIPPAQWITFLRGLFIDLAVAPLRVNAFNRAKSNLRHLEWNAIGVPVIATKIDPYLQNKGPLIPPLKDIGKESEHWIEVIRELARNEPLRRALADDSFVSAARFNLEGNLPVIKSAWMLPLEKKPLVTLH